MIAKPARITSGFVAVGIAAILLVLAGGAFTSYFFVSHGIAQLVDEQARAAPDTYIVYLARERDTRRAAVQSVLHLTREGVRVRFFSNRERFVVDPDGSIRASSPRFGGFGPFGFGGPPPGASAPPQGASRDLVLPAPPGGNGNERLPEGAGPPPESAAFPAALPRSFTRTRNLLFLSDLLGIPTRRVIVGDGVFSIEPDVEILADQLRVAAFATLAVAVLVIVMLVLLGRTVRREALRPLLETTAALNRLAARDFTPYAIRTQQRDEIGALARAYTSASATVAAAFEERRLAQAEMQRFVADAGHELRTPLTVVTGYLDVLEGGAIDDPALTQRIFATLRSESRRMRGLIDNLIVLARLEQFDAHRGDTVDACSVVSRVVHTFAPLAPAGEIAFHAPEHAYVLAQESELYEALANLVENALKHAEGAAIAVTVTAEPERVSIAVADDGPGMNADESGHAFERFYRGERRGETPGSGLGLAIVKRTVERVGGSVDLVSAENAGTTITLRFPRADAPRDERASTRIADESIP
jgi:two-component system OmpR family sensor kinase